MRVTTTVHQVLQVFLEDPTARRYGLELMKAANLPSGTLYPILARLERDGWLQSEKEAAPPGGRPARRYYVLTPPGAENARRARAELSAQLRLSHRDNVLGTTAPQGQLS
jgi:DNA-binding PadR family transcriptional regulator